MEAPWHEGSEQPIVTLVLGTFPRSRDVQNRLHSPQFSTRLNVENSDPLSTVMVLKTCENLFQILLSDCMAFRTGLHPCRNRMAI